MRLTLHATMSLAVLLACGICSSAEAQEPSRVGDDGDPVRRSLFMVDLNDKYGWMDRTGEIVIDLQFNNIQTAQDFSEGLAAVQFERGGPYGYIDESGAIAIEPQFDDAVLFREGLARVKVGGLWGYIDKAGQMVVEPRFADCSSLGSAYVASCNYFNEGMARVVLDGKWGYINRTGEVVVKIRFDRAFDFSDGLAAVTIGDKCGYIDTRGDFAIEPQFDSCNLSQEGIVRVRSSGEYLLLDGTGQPVAHPRGPGYEHSLVHINGESGYTDDEGRKVTSARMRWGQEFRDGLAGVYFGSSSRAENVFVLLPDGTSQRVTRDPERVGPRRCGYINEAREMVIKPVFELCSEFSEGLARVEREDAMCGYIDRTGQIVIELRFKYCANFEGGLAWGFLTGSGNWRTYMNQDGVIIRPH